MTGIQTLRPDPSLSFLPQGGNSPAHHLRVLVHRGVELQLLVHVRGQDLERTVGPHLVLELEGVRNADAQPVCDG